MAETTSAAALENTQKLENAIRAVNEKRPPPEIDFTLHTMEDGTQVSTLERVCKGISNTTFKIIYSPQMRPAMLTLEISRSLY
jgi:serine/threonine-protein phosphatase 2B catalytic subunit